METAPENHAAHTCVDEYVHRLKEAADMILLIWRSAGLPCQAVKGWEITNGFGKARGPSLGELVPALEEIAESMSAELPEPDINNESPLCDCGEPTCMGTCYGDSD